MSNQPCPLHHQIEQQHKSFQEDSKCFRDNVSDITTKIAVISGQITHLSERFDKHGKDIVNIANVLNDRLAIVDRVLYGDNDKIGLLSRVKSNEDWISAKKTDWTVRVNIAYQVVMTAMVTILLAKVGF